MSRAFNGVLCARADVLIPRTPLVSFWDNAAQRRGRVCAFGQLIGHGRDSSSDISSDSESDSSDDSRDRRSYRRSSTPPPRRGIPPPSRISSVRAPKSDTRKVIDGEVLSLWVIQRGHASIQCVDLGVHKPFFESR